MKEPAILKFGTGRIHVALGRAFGAKALLFTDTGEPQVVGTTVKDEDTIEELETFDVVMTFENIESARLLQDMVNELLCKWSREVCPSLHSKGELAPLQPNIFYKLKPCGEA